MVDITTSYIAFLALSAVLFWRLETRLAILIVFFGGWLVLPVGPYPPLQPSDGFAWWITGLALPGDMLLSKAWGVPAVALAGAMLADRRAVGRFRPCRWDLPVLLWCLWPLGLALSGTALRPEAPLAAAYLTGCWGLPWLLGRIWFSDTAGRVALLKGCAGAGAACLPFALLEGTGTLRFYEVLYTPHPFRDDGWARYVGFRPVGLFEHGNQYGIWVALSALAALWGAVTYRQTGSGRRWLFLALLTLAIACAAQSIGALLSLIAGGAILAGWGRRLTGLLLMAGFGALGLLAALHLSGVVPLEYIARQTAIGQTLLEGFRTVGRGSFLWRISADLKSLEIAQEVFLQGTGLWDWWRPSDSRPWGLWLLLIGQFGLIGFLLCYGTLLALAGRGLYHLRRMPAWVGSSAALPLALIVIFALLDSFLNAFFYFPALLAAGAIAADRAHPQTL
ncbi:hypothetical protein [Roseobacter weihaiensis]|uniref:hypothetical protein n=1 Tax=Roseobacter weihaiensis TaxID=2763262 RepID=UPI001D0AFB5A|nr:hypothetical protein [Roseobacter sp. H9]